jgi:hypothetical protein
MDACPVCETPHDPAALECAICGHIFRPAAVDASIVPLPDLETTLAATSSIAVETTPGLEPTRFEAAGPLAAGPPLEGLEPTLAPSSPVVSEATPGLEPTRLAEEDLPSIFPADVTCSNCGEPGAEEQAFCNRCGMQLPRTRRVVAETTSVPTCTSCGETSFVGGVCRRCGVRQPTAP